MCQVIQFHEAELAFYKLTMYLSFEKILCGYVKGPPMLTTLKFEIDKTVHSTDFQFHHHSRTVESVSVCLHNFHNKHHI